MAPAVHTTEEMSQNKRPKQVKKYKRKYKAKDVDPTLPMGVLQLEIKDILAAHNLTEASVANDMRELLNDKSVEQVFHRTVDDVKVLQLSSNGDGLALIPHPVNLSGHQIAVVPFALPGDTVRIRVFKTHPLFVESDLLEVTASSADRDDSLIQCKYFGKCSGCQFQNVEFENQLKIKRTTIVNAYKFFAPKLLDSGSLPDVSPTQASPLQYKYRTKLTPHFNVPNRIPESYTRPSVGFGAKGRPEWRDAEGGNALILDIEECLIGTEIVNVGMSNERARFEGNYKNYKRGATILLREHTSEKEIEIGSTNPEGQISTIDVQSNGTTLHKSCVTDSRAVVSEYVKGFKFDFSAGEFFQNNQLILPIVTDYVKENLHIPGLADNEPHYLVDAYCGSGLFSITCLGSVSKVIGVEVSADSVKFAQRNAEANQIENAKFIVGKAEEIFKNIDTPSHSTAVILDPPRKGCDSVFLNQLSEYKPAKIVYVSCNVHSQARDVEWFLLNTPAGSDYEVKSIKGFDFFPQTHHVESVAVLALKDSK